MFNTTHQSANGNVYNVEVNIQSPVTVGDASAGSGAVHQSNAATNESSAFNLNHTFQSLLHVAGIHIFRF